jgi:hypothetical protein
MTSLWLPGAPRFGKPRAVRAGVGKKALFAVAPVVLLAAVAEGWFRIAPHEDAYPTHTGIVEAAEPELIWRLRPSPSGPLATNELGLRDGPYRADADFKILLLGDSVSWGNGINDSDALYASRLEVELNGQGRGISYEVINSGVPGYSTFQELAYLRWNTASARLVSDFPRTERHARDHRGIMACVEAPCWHVTERNGLSGEPSR